MSRGSGRILLLGGDGQVGFELQRTLAPLGEVIAPAPDRADLARPSSLRDVVRAIRPDVVVNAAAYTQVDKAESEPELAMRINGESPGVLAEEAGELGALMIHYSTDAVYDGGKGAAYVEGDAPNPINQYGRSKLAGDRAVAAGGGRHFILRTSWVYAARGHNFVKTILRLASQRDEIRVVDDQFGNPTSARVLAGLTAQFLAAARSAPEALRPGVYHASGSGSTSWFHFAEEIVGMAGAAARIVPIPTSEYPLPAARGKDCRLDCGKITALLHCAIPSWRESLREVIDQLLAAPSG